MSQVTSIDNMGFDLQNIYFIETERDLKYKYFEVAFTKIEGCLYIKHLSYNLKAFPICYIEESF